MSLSVLMPGLIRYLSLLIFAVLYDIYSILMPCCAAKTNLQIYQNPRTRLKIHMQAGELTYLGK